MMTEIQCTSRAKHAAKSSEEIERSPQVKRSHEDKKIDDNLPELVATWRSWQIGDFCKGNFAKSPESYPDPKINQPQFRKIPVKVGRFSPKQPIDSPATLAMIERKSEIQDRIACFWPLSTLAFETDLR